MFQDQVCRVGVRVRVRFKVRRVGPNGVRGQATYRYNVFLWFVSSMVKNIS